MFLFWYWFSWVTCYNRDCLYRCGFVTYTCLPFDRQSSFGFGIKYFVLTFCGCSLIVFIHINLLLGFIIFFMVRISILLVHMNNIFFSAYYINDLLAYFFNKLTKNKTFTFISRYVKVYYDDRSAYFSIYKYSVLVLGLFQFVCFLYSIMDYYVIHLILLDWHIFCTYGKSMICTIRICRSYVYMFFQISFIFHTLFNNVVTNLDNPLIILYLIIMIISIFALLYINILDVEFKTKYPYLYGLITLISILSLAISLYLVWITPNGTPNGTSNGTPNGTPGPSHRPNMNSGNSSGPNGGPPGPNEGPNGYNGGPSRSNGHGHGHRHRDRSNHWGLGRSTLHRNRPGERFENQYPEHQSMYPDWTGTGPNGIDRPQTPERSPTPEFISPNRYQVFPNPGLPWHQARYHFTARLAPPFTYGRHWEGQLIYTDSAPNNGDTYRWNNDIRPWLPTRNGLWVSRDFTFINNEWRWEVGRVYRDIHGSYFEKWYS